MKHGRIVEIEDAEQRASPAQRQALVAAIVLADPDRVRQIVEHLGEGERDHDEIDADGAQHDQTDQCRQRHRKKDGGGIGDKAVLDAEMGEHADDIAAGAEEHGVAEADQSAVAQQDIEADRHHRQHDDARGDPHEVGVAEQRHDQQNGKPRQHDGVAQIEPLRTEQERPGEHGFAASYPRPAANRPLGRKNRTQAMAR